MSKSPTVDKKTWVISDGRGEVLSIQSALLPTSTSSDEDLKSTTEVASDGNLQLKETAFGGSSMRADTLYEGTSDVYVDPVTRRSSSQTAREKSLVKWGIERKRSAKELLGIWRKSMSDTESPSFCVYLNELKAAISKEMPKYRGVDFEDYYSQVLQVLLESLEIGAKTGNFKKGMLRLVTSTLETMIESRTLSFELYESICDEFIENGYWRVC